MTKIWTNEKRYRILAGNYCTIYGNVDRSTRHYVPKRCVDAVNEMANLNCLAMPRKATIRFGLSKDVDGVWRVEQLPQELQDIVNL